MDSTTIHRGLPSHAASLLPATAWAKTPPPASPFLPGEGSPKHPSSTTTHPQTQHSPNTPQNKGLPASKTRPRGRGPTENPPKTGGWEARPAPRKIKTSVPVRAGWILKYGQSCYFYRGVFILGGRWDGFGSLFSSARRCAEVGWSWLYLKASPPAHFFLTPCTSRCRPPLRKNAAKKRQ